VINNRDEAILKKFGNHLRELRLQQGLSQQRLGLIADISKNQIGNIERGEVNITLTTSVAIAKALKISVSRLLEVDLD
jgi:transcriptional regulator with XRE-family HTH domain